MVRNFLFHRVHPDKDPLYDPMRPEQFEKCIRYISKKYKIVRIEDLVFSDQLFEKNKYATIDFDDGYKDNIDYALPILDKYKVKASFYVVTDCINKNIPTWTVIFDNAFKQTNKSELNLNFDFLPKNLRVDKLQTREDRINYAIKLKPDLKLLNHVDRNKVLDHIHLKFDDVEIPKLMMNWDDLKMLKEQGHYIGSHTLSHNMLGALSDENEIRNELETSAKEIEKRLGHFPISVSYPVGSYNDTTIRICKEVGYKLGLAVKRKIYNPKKSSVFEISRIELFNEPWWKTRLRMTNFIQTVRNIARRK